MHAEIESVKKILDLFAAEENKDIKTRYVEIVRLKLDSILMGVTDNRLTHTEVQAGLYDGKIPCIKMHRERTSMGLRESKETVEAYFASHNLQFGPIRY